MKTRLIFIFCLVLVLFSCSNKTEKTNILDLSNLKSTEGWFDIPLSVTETEELNEYYEYTAKGILNNDTIGIKIRLKKNIPPGFVNGEPKNMFLEKGIEFISNGNESDRLLSFMASKYGVDKANLKFKKGQIFTCANLNQSKPNYKTGENKFKIFLEGHEEAYAELFVNFNFSEKVISFNEKDTEYREALIDLLKE